MPRVSAVVNTCNEAHHLRECVESLRGFADEIVVCDMESTDGSAELAKELGCKVISHRRMPAPEPDARIAAINAASGDWILVFDPDMRLPKETAEKLQEVVSKDQADVVDFYCMNYFLGRLCLHGHGSQPVFRKFFKKSSFFPNDVNIQTFWYDSLKGRVITLPRQFPLLHYSYPTLQKMTETFSRYAKREAEQAFAQGVHFSVWRMLWKPLKRFIGNYFLRRGFLDGMPGFLVSVSVSWYIFLIYAHLWEIQRQSKRVSGSSNLGR
jgi:glycosyltransferase involved in cell wall biosynthesis